MKHRLIGRDVRNITLRCPGCGAKSFDLEGSDENYSGNYRLRLTCDCGAEFNIVYDDFRVIACTETFKQKRDYKGVGRVPENYSELISGGGRFPPRANHLIPLYRRSLLGFQHPFPVLHLPRQSKPEFQKLSLISTTFLSKRFSASKISVVPDDLSIRELISLCLALRGNEELIPE